jgi:hypothetical protein
MATKKITQLTPELTNPVDADLIPIDDTTILKTKHISWGTIKSLLRTYFGTIFLGVDSTTADVDDSSDRRYCTNAEKVIIENTDGTNTGNETASSIGSLIYTAAAKNTPIDADQIGLMDSAASNVLKKFSWAKLKTGISTLYKSFVNASIVGITGSYATDTYLEGSCITIPTAGIWQSGTVYRLVFDMVKTAAGTAKFTIKVRMGTLGTIDDPAITTLDFDAGTAAADTGKFEVFCTFRSVGSGTSAIMRSIAVCSHLLAATGLTTSGAAGIGFKSNTSSGFNSTTQTKIGVSINGGTSFSGNCSTVQAELLGLIV